MKRVNFKKITIKNFLSIGEEPVVVEFKKGLHVITGENKDKPDRRNAIGKSTIADSVYFAIFGETLREIKKDLIPNNLTSGKTHVELDFEVITTNSQKEYKIVRTLSPTKVFVYEDGVDKTHDSIANTTKFILDVLSATPAIFKNCVIMTVNNAIPFMAKNKIEKRKFIEDIFGMEVFSEMTSRLRSEYNDIKRDYDTLVTTLDEVQRSHKNYTQQRDNIINKRSEKKELYLQRKSNNITERKELIEYISNIPEIDITATSKDIENCEKGIATCDDKIASLTTEIATDKQRIHTIKDTYQKIGTQEEKCPVCLREMKEHDLSYIEAEKQTLKSQIEQIAETVKQKAQDLETINKKKLSIKNKITQLHNNKNAAALREQDRKNKEQRIEQLDSWLLELEQDLESVQSTETDFDSVIVETTERLNTITTQTEEKKNKLSSLDIVKFIVSEEGVKSYIVSRLLELLNSKLLFYLKKLDSNSICIFNEYFEEEILNEKNKVCSYFNFSGAERKSIDLACLFAFSDIRKLQGGVQYNIAMYDELFDSSFDEKGLELITTILRERVQEIDECTMIISHRKESIKAATGSIVYLEKENGITRRKQYDDV
jgi:DNA repair exonuclease SbcCD ATPase subunit